MKGLILYSSQTGNTEKLAKTMARILSEKYAVALQKIQPGNRETGEAYDFVLLGGWIHRAMPDKKMQQALSRLKPKAMGLFVTMGDDPASPHGQTVGRNLEILLKGHQSLGWGICRGTVDAKVLEGLNRIPDLIIPKTAKETMIRVANNAREATEDEREQVARAFTHRIQRRRT